mgnify:CR=1 FL=1
MTETSPQFRQFVEQTVVRAAAHQCDDGDSPTDPKVLERDAADLLTRTLVVEMLADSAIPKALDDPVDDARALLDSTFLDAPSDDEWTEVSRTFAAELRAELRRFLDVPHPARRLGELKQYLEAGQLVLQPEPCFEANTARRDREIGRAHV